MLWLLLGIKLITKINCHSLTETVAVDMYNVAIHNYICIQLLHCHR